jgi:hypothetical protein
MKQPMEPRPRQLAFSDFSASFTTDGGQDVRVAAYSGQRIIRVECDGFQVDLTKQDACSLRFKLGKALRMAFGVYAD